MNERVCLVTGANSGVGKEIALGLASQGARVLMVCRDAVKGQAALEEIKAKSGSQKIDLLLADLSSQASLRSLAEQIHERYPALHVLINNAGVVLREQQYSVDKIEMTLATNYLGPFLLTMLLLDLLKTSAPSRIVNVSSAIHQWARLDLSDLQFRQRRYQWVKAYSQSKLLMNLATFELARRLHGTGVTVNCLHPGAVKTQLGSSNANNLPLKLLDKCIKCFFITPEAGAKTPLYLATAREVENITGKYFVKCETNFSKASAYKPEEVKKIWDESERLLGLR
jgi:NAD(P)-dependent dehydrogenase (short-subunit alcohol dehydrogenase family)